MGRTGDAEIGVNEEGKQAGEAVGAPRSPQTPWTPVCFCCPQSPPAGWASTRQLLRRNWAETSQEAMLLPAEWPSPATGGAGPQVLYFGRENSERHSQPSPRRNQPETAAAGRALSRPRLLRPLSPLHSSLWKVPFTFQALANPRFRSCPEDSCLRLCCQTVQFKSLYSRGP